MAKGDIITPPGTGHVHNLTPDQKKILKEVWSIIFSIEDSGEASVQAAGHGEGVTKISLEDLGMSVEKLRPILWDNVMGDHPDSLILRFIRARKWNVVNALNMMFKAFKWRLDEDIPAIKYSTDGELNALYPKFFEQLESGKFYVHGTDNEDRIIVYLNVRLHKPNDQPAKTLEKLTVYVMEAGRVLLQPPVETVCLVFDLTGFSLSNMDFAMVKYLLQIFEAHYPESLGRVLIHGAPFVFWGVWKVIQPWMDPVVASKISFTRSDQELLQYIPAKHLPDRFKGGLDKYTYSYPHAQPNENQCMADTETKERLVAEWKAVFSKFEGLTREWIKVGTPEATSSRTEEEIEKEREQTAKDLRVAFFKMDPYTRSRNMFHRTSPPIAKNDGSVNWIYNN